VVADIGRMQHATAHLEYLAHHDALTGLPNRTLLYLRLRHTIERAARESSRCAVLFLDLDGFKRVNDSMGHQAGDELLRQAAARMQTRVRHVDTLARFGGDEFVLVLDRVLGPEDAALVARTLIERLDEPFPLPDDKEARVGVSVGISVFPDDAADADTVLGRADAALYEAKAAGRGTFRFYARTAAAVECREPNAAAPQ
jgi:diguanylate cyclase (GGDEF)-like protein